MLLIDQKYQPPMNKALKYAGLLAILPLFTVVMTTGFVEDAFAKTSKFHNTPKICGDKICDSSNRNDSEKEREEKRMAFAKSTTTPVEEKEEPKMEETMMEETMMEESIDESDLGSVLRLSRANVPATIPLHQGYYNGGEVYFIITDSSDKTHADIITKNQDWKVELAPLLANAPAEALSRTYMFTNGVTGDGVHGFQGEVLTSTPAQAESYSALTSHVHVTWNNEADAKLLTSEEDIFAAVDAGTVSLTELDVVLNMPQIVWPDGQMMVKEDKTLTDDTPYGGGQVLDIDLDEKTVTFIAHRGWGPDGRTIYYIVTDAAPVGPANMMGVVDAPVNAKLIANSAAVDLFQFRNGITGSGPLGFQAGIAASAPGDSNYSPMWRIFMIGWEDPDNALLLENKADIDAMQQAGLISVGIARPMDSDHIVNCPFIDPFQ